MVQGSRLIQVLSLAAVVWFFWACENGAVEPVQEPLEYRLSALETDLIRSSNELGANLLRELNREFPSENILISPFSAGMGLGMLYNASGEATRSEVLQTLGLIHFDERDLNKTFNGLASYLTLLNSQSGFSLINGLWYPQSIRAGEACRSRIMAYYDADMEGLDYGKTGSWSYVNKWAGYKSNGKIPVLLSAIPAESEVILTNAAAFHGRWTFAFDPARTRTEGFRATATSAVRVPMMYAPAIPAVYARHEGAEYVALSLGRGSLAFAVLLPPEEKDLGEYVAALEPDQLSVFFSLRDTAVISLKIPRISLEVQKPLMRALAATGMPSLGGGHSTLSELFQGEAPGMGLAIEHKCSLLLSESGLVGGSEAVFEGAPSGVSVVLNRPFLFAIIEVHSGAVVMAGLMHQPAFAPAGQDKQ
jgi:serine protease inhibitor